MTDQVTDRQPGGDGGGASPASAPSVEPPTSPQPPASTASRGDDDPSSSEQAKPPKRRRLGARLAHGLIALATLAGGAAVMVALARTAPEPAPTPSRAQGPLVSVEPVVLADAPIEVSGFGTVQPRREVDIVPQVGGQVVAVHPALTDGGMIEAGETVIRIDRRDYALAVRAARADVDQAEGALAEAEASVEQASASIERARTALAVERAEAEVRLAEWRAEHGREAAAPDLVARRPQIREREAMLASARAERAAAEASVASAKARLASAEAALERAELDLDRTTLTAPFDARVLEASVARGQAVAAGQSLATLYSREVMRIVVPLDDASMRWIELPEAKAGISAEAAYARGAPVRVRADYAGQPREWRGRALHTTGRVDSRTRLVEVVVEVRQPSGRTDPPPLVPGMFVTAYFSGPVLEGVARIPRHAVREGDRVWVAERLSAELEPIRWSEPWASEMALHARLRLRPVEIARSERETSLIRAGLEAGDLVVTSALDVVTDGMRIRLPTPTTRPTGQAPQGAAAEPTPTPPADAEPDDAANGEAEAR